MSILLHKSYIRLQQSRIRYFSHWHNVQSSPPRSSPPKAATFSYCSTLQSSFLSSRHSALSGLMKTGEFLYPTSASFYTTLALQTTPSHISTSTETTKPRRCHSNPFWSKQSQTLFIKAQQLIDAGNYKAAIQLAKSIPPPLGHHSDMTSCAINFMDPYSILLEQRLGQGQWDEGIADYQQLLSTPWGKSLLPYNRRTVKATLLFYCAKGQWDDVERILKNLKITMTPVTIGRMIVTLMRLKKPPHHHHHHLKKSSSSYNYAVGGKHIVRALQAFERTLELQVTSKTLAKILEHLGDRGNLGDSYRLYKWVRGKKSGTNVKCPKDRRRCSGSVIYLAMIEAAIKNNDTAMAESVWHDRLYRGMFNGDTTHQFKPATLSAYNLLLNIYASQLPFPQLTRVRRTFRRLLNAGYQPNTYTYNTLIKAFVNAGDLDKAYQMFNTMIHSGGSNNNNNTTRPDSRSINLLLRGWIEKKEWHHVELFIRQQQQQEMADNDGKQLQLQLDNKYTFNIILQGFLQLEARRMAVDRILKSQGDWSQWKHLQRSQQPYSLPPHIIWEIFESATGGYTAQHIKDCLSSGKTSLEFDNSFDQQGFNRISCKLFIKAFTLAKDQSSAELIKKWMIYSNYPQLSST